MPWSPPGAYCPSCPVGPTAVHTVCTIPSRHGAMGQNGSQTNILESCSSLSQFKQNEKQGERGMQHTQGRYMEWKDLPGLHVTPTLPRQPSLLAAWI